MKKLLFFLLLSGFAFGQQKTLFKTVSYNELIALYNQKLDIKNETLSENIERCKHIVKTAKESKDYDTEVAFGLFLLGMQEAEKINDKNKAFISIYQDPTSYNFYDYKERFVGRIYNDKMQDEIEAKGNNTETFVSQLFYLIQE